MAHGDVDAAFATLAIHGGQTVCPTTGAVFPPLYTSSTCAALRGAGAGGGSAHALAARVRAEPRMHLTARAQRPAAAAQRPPSNPAPHDHPPPSHRSYVQRSPGVHQGFEYSRSHNPTRFAFERCVASLEGTRLSEAEDRTCGGFAFASGLAAAAAAMDLLDAGATIVCMDDV